MERQARMDLLLVSFPKGLTFLCLISDVGLNLLSHILPLKLRITSISSVSFGESSLAPPCTGNRMASFENVSPTTSRSFEIVITDLRQPGALIPIVGIAKSRIQLYLILLTFLCLISDVGLNLLSHILPLKLRITSISSVSFGESSLAPPCTGNRMASFENVSPTTSRSFEIVITDLRQPGALIPIVGIAKSRIQLYLILLVRYCPLWALEAGPHGFTFGFLPKRPRTIRTFLCLISDVGLNLLSHILPLKLRITSISSVSFGESSLAPPCTGNRMASFENVSPTTSRSFEIVITGSMIILTVSAEPPLFLLEGYFGLLADLRQPGALIPIVGIAKSRVQLYLILLLRITSISSVSFGESSLAPPCTGNRMASFENVSPTTSRSFEIVITDLRQPGSDTNCWDCEIPYPTLSYLISTILSTLGLGGRPAWIYFWFPSQKASIEMP
ncbi:hypothetical protein IGI04_023785 [Brassica rapa subsp. trilocularis]|uniref:Uncharacterized protein n=1 Tax=Brassica rapa subsp. trilocularis TaxID=1813537 RepID=A0ABQ7M5I3_BRACM|nr:hypothetical protein IGI04_023785 [Brassica rapa subsp. trilocularis]